MLLLQGVFMRRSIATVSLSGTLPEKLEAIAAARFDAVEIFENDLLLFDASPREVHRIASSLGIGIDLFQPLRDFEGVSDEIFKQNLERAERKFDMMGELGAPMLLVCSNVQPDVISDDHRTAEQLYILAERAARHGLKVGYEALAWGTHVRTSNHAWSIIDKADHPNLGLILDSFHTLALPNERLDLSNIPGHRIFFVQLADVPRLGMSPMILSRHFRNLPGQGDLDLPHFLDAVLSTGYSGTISLEIFNDDLRSAPPRQTALDAMRSILYLEEKVRRIGEQSRATTPKAPKAQILQNSAGEEIQHYTARKAAPRQRRRVELFDPPAPPQCPGIAFVEFAIDTHGEVKLRDMLMRLGFRHIGRHRSKDVALYAQGDMRIVLNMERECFAHSYFLMHGPSVCALALKTDDAFTALARAEAYGCKRFEGRVGPNEKAIPAVRSLDGSLIYFVHFASGDATTFETDFILNPKALVTGLAPKLTRIDHVAQALHGARLDAWILFYRAVLGLEPEDIFVLPDAYGLVRSRAVSNPERTLRFPLNIAESRNTATARSVTTYSGSGVHHIAFATDDVFEAAAALKANGVELLQIPASYYESVGARFELSNELVTRMQELNLLYDRDEQGEYLHVNTMPFENRFFFEVVQRIRGYDQYGAANASVRMTAMDQSRSMDASALRRQDEVGV
jgi:4-hydroxyphenylpyruvate dioxygenase